MRFAASVRFVLLLALLPGCGDSDVIVMDLGLIDTLAVSPELLVMEVGDSATLVVSAVDALGFPIPVEVAWVSTAPSIASVSTNGLVTGLASGTTQVFATGDGSATVAVPVVVVSIGMMIDGGNRRFGPLPVVPYALADDATGTDIYPLGNGAGYLFGLFDTGTTRVRIFNEIPYFFDAFPVLDPNPGLIANVPNRLTDGNFFNSDASQLGLVTEETTRVRLNGLGAIDPATLGVPIGLGQAQLEVSGIPARPEPTNLARRLNVTLIGGLINQSVVAAIDYATRVQRSGYDFYPGLIDRTETGTGVTGFSPIDAVAAPDITFYSPADPTIPTLRLEFLLTRIGVPAVRYGLVDIEFRDGPNLFRGQDPMVQEQPNILFDTGTTITIIGDAIASRLALMPGSGTFDCLDGSSNGYVLDVIRINGPSGSYAVINASVCWSQPDVPLWLAAITGSSLFDQVPIVFDGFGNRLWVGEPTATPVNWTSGAPRHF
jgi:Bacterial Ig-like domain (group 2)